MFDLERCQPVSSTKLWTLASWSLFYIIARPLLAIALIAALILLFLAIIPPSKRSKWRKRAVILGSTVLFLYSLLITPVLASISSPFLTRNLPPNSSETADAIVVLGRGEDQNNIRAQKTAELWRNQRAPLIIASGRVDTPLIISLWQQANPPIEEGAIAGEPCSLTTEQNAQFTAALFWPQGIRKIILVTDKPHMRRSQLTFESFGFEVIPHVIPFETSSRARKNVLAVRESLGLISYGLKNRYSPRAVPSVSTIEGR